MATKNPDNVKTRKGKEGDTYYENTALAGRLKGKGINVKVGPVTSDRTQRKATNMAKRKEYASKRSSAPTKRTTTAGNATQPVSRPQNVQGPLMQNGSYGNAPATPPAQTFAQNGMQRGTPPQPQYNPLPNYNMQRQGPPAQLQYNPLPQNRPSAFGQQPQLQQPYQQPNSSVTMGIQPNPYGFGWNPTMNPWGKRW